MRLKKVIDIDFQDNQCIMQTHQYVNSCTAELFVSIFHSFEAGIANAISSFKWMKTSIIYKT